MSYKGYEGVAELDDEAGVFHGQVIGIRDVVTFRGGSVEELRQSFRDSIDAYLTFCAKRGEDPDKPFSGRLLVRMPSDLHREISITAQRGGQSINKWIVDQLSILIRAKISKVG